MDQECIQQQVVHQDLSAGGWNVKATAAGAIAATCRWIKNS